MSMQKGKPIRSKVTSKSPWQAPDLRRLVTVGRESMQKRGKGDKMKVYYYSGWIFWLLQHPHTARQQLTLGRSVEVHSLEKLKIRNPRISDPRQSRRQWSWGLKTGIKWKSEHGRMRVWAQLLSLYFSLSGVFHPSCSQLGKRLKNSLDKPYSPKDIRTWGHLNKMASWTIQSFHPTLNSAYGLFIERQKEKEKKPVETEMIKKREENYKVQ